MSRLLSLLLLLEEARAGPSRERRRRERERDTINMSLAEIVSTVTVLIQSMVSSPATHVQT